MVEDGDRACALICRRAALLRRPRSRRLDCVDPLWEEGSALLRRHGRCTAAATLAGDRCNRAYTEPFPEYTEVMLLREGRARICREGLYGFIDAGGRESVAPVYPFAGAFREGRAKVRLQEDYFLYRPRRMQNRGVRRILCPNKLYIFSANFVNFRTKRNNDSGKFCNLQIKILPSLLCIPPESAGNPLRCSLF